MRIIIFHISFLLFSLSSIAALATGALNLTEPPKTAAPEAPVAPEINITGFNKWVEDFKIEAEQKGLKKETLSLALDNMEPVIKAVQLDKKQPEVNADFNKYKGIILTKERISEGRKLLKENNVLLQKVSKKYGVQPRFIVALWGIETNFGKKTGDFYVPASLATLAYEGRRRDFFKKELLAALKIIEEGHIKPESMKGSWAGAMGQSQFMPSSFISYAVDFNGDKRRDIWTTKDDVFASIANYLHTVGWDKDTTWGRKVRVPKNFNNTMKNVKPKLKEAKSLKEWQKLGIRNESGGSLPHKDIKAYLVQPGGEKNDSYLVYDNYTSLLDWNRSLFFATAVGLLSDAIVR